MSIEPNKFTHSTLSSQDWFSLIGASPTRFCEITQPEECKRAAPELREACERIFQDCKEFAEQLERWHGLD